jgi:hypothetical protein
MKILPIEIQNEIWKLYYMNIYQNNIFELNNIFCQIINFDKNIENIKKNLRIIRFSNNENQIKITKEYLKKNLKIYNQIIYKIIKNKPDNIIIQNNDIFLHIKQLVKLENYYIDIPLKYRLVSAYFNKYNNFQENIMKRLKKTIQ